MVSGVARLVSGVARLVSGVVKLVSGVAKIVSGVAKIVSGVVKMISGSCQDSLGRCRGGGQRGGGLSVGDDLDAARLGEDGGLDVAAGGALVPYLDGAIGGGVGALGPVEMTQMWSYAQGAASRLDYLKPQHVARQPGGGT